MKSIRKKITVCLMATVLTALILVGAVSIALNYRSTIATVGQMMSETAALAAERVEQELTAYKNVAMDTGCIPQLSDDSVSLEDKLAIINERVTMHGFQRGNIVDADGLSIFDGKDYSDREYVQQAMQGKVYGASLCRRKPGRRNRRRRIFCAAGDVLKRHCIFDQGQPEQQGLHDQ